MYNENIINDKCKLPQIYTAILCHKKENLEFAKNNFGDTYNRLYISDTNVEGTLDCHIEGYDSRVFGELTAWMWLSKTLKEQDWVSLNAYRRKLNLGEGTLVAYPIKFECNLLEQLAHDHSPIYCDVLKTILPNNEFNFLENNILFPYNIFQTDIFTAKHWCTFMKCRLDAFFKCLGFQPTLENCINFVKNEPSVLKPMHNKNINAEYQSRIGAFILERLNSIYWQIIGGWIPTKLNLLEPGQIF